MDNSDFFYLKSGRLSVAGNREYLAASAEELRVLLAAAELSGGIPTAKIIAEVAGVSDARAKAALALWVESGILERTAGEKDDPFASSNIIEEFAPRFGDAVEETALETADAIRNKSLDGLIGDIARMMKVSGLSTSEAKTVVSLITQGGLSPEYVTVLAASLAEQDRLTVSRLAGEARKLIDKEIDKLPALTLYLSKKAEESKMEVDFRRTLGIYNRSFSKSEREFFVRWTEELGFGLDIIGEAYDITVINTGKISFKYMDKLLTDWNAVGAKTVEACREAHAASGAAIEAKKKTAAKPKERVISRNTGVISNFNAEQALQSILDRSFAEEPNAESKQEDKA